jgi:hypothetical protein
MQEILMRKKLAALAVAAIAGTSIAMGGNALASTSAPAAHTLNVMPRSGHDGDGYQSYERRSYGNWDRKHYWHHGHEYGHRRDHEHHRGYEYRR